MQVATMRSFAKKTATKKAQKQVEHDWEAELRGRAAANGIVFIPRSERSKTYCFSCNAREVSLLWCHNCGEMVCAQCRLLEGTPVIHPMCQKKTLLIHELARRNDLAVACYIAI